MNKAIIQGRLTKDPEIRDTQSGIAVTNFTVAVDRSYKNKDGSRETDFIPCVAWRQTAEHIARYYKKGNRILVEGSIQIRNWEDDQGQRRYITEIVVEQSYFCESNNQQQTQQQVQQPQASDGRREAALLEALEETELPFSMD